MSRISEISVVSGEFPLSILVHLFDLFKNIFGAVSRLNNFNWRQFIVQPGKEVNYKFLSIF